MPWTRLPPDYPPFRTVYHYARAWERAGVWDRARRRCPADDKCQLAHLTADVLARLGTTAWTGAAAT